LDLLILLFGTAILTLLRYLNTAWYKAYSNREIGYAH